MTREEELDWLCRLRSKIYVFMPREWLIPMNDALDMAIKALEQEPKWIPVSERLPDERKNCLVTFKDGYVDIMCYALDLYKVDNYDFYAKKGKAGWYEYDSEWGFYSRDDVIAWMPLPEPYEAESEDKGCL